MLIAHVCLQAVSCGEPLPLVPLPPAPTWGSGASALSPIEWVWWVCVLLSSAECSVLFSEIYLTIMLKAVIWNFK